MSIKKTSFQSIRSLLLMALFLISACGEKNSTTEPQVKTTVETTTPIRYLGLRLFDIPDSPNPFALEKEFTECVFDKPDIDDWPTFTKSCNMINLASTYKERQDEKVYIDTIVARCCGVIAATIGTNQSTYENTLRIFDELPGVEKKPVQCKNLETNMASWTKEFFIVSKNGTDKFVIQEETSGGSGGNSTSTRIYFNMVTPDCNEIERLDKSLDDEGKKRIESIAEQSSNNNRPTSTNGLFGKLQCNYTYFIAMATGAAVELKGKENYSFKFSGPLGTVTYPSNSIEKIKFISMNVGDKSTGYIYWPVSPGDIPFEFQFNMEPDGTISGLMTIKQSPMGELMALGLCKRI